jgi:hypothetical protein
MFSPPQPSLLNTQKERQEALAKKKKSNTANRDAGREIQK